MKYRVCDDFGRRIAESDSYVAAVRKAVDLGGVVHGPHGFLWPPQHRNPLTPEPVDPTADTIPAPDLDADPADAGLEG